VSRRAWRLPVEAGLPCRPEPGPRAHGPVARVDGLEHVAVLELRVWTISSIFQMEPQGTSAAVSRASQVRDHRWRARTR